MNHKMRLLEQMNLEAQLIWSRYSIMVVAHSLFVGFITRGSETSEVAFFACIGGAIVAYIWWALTSYGWDLSHKFGRAAKSSSPDPKEDIWNIYEKWRSNWPNEFMGFDVIWWSAHVIVWVFITGYAGLAAWSASQAWSGVHALLGFGFVYPGVVIGVAWFLDKRHKYTCHVMTTADK